MNSILVSFSQPLEGAAAQTTVKNYVTVSLDAQYNREAMMDAEYFYN